VLTRPPPRQRPRCSARAPACQPHSPTATRRTGRSVTCARLVSWSWVPPPGRASRSGVVPPSLARVAAVTLAGRAARSGPPDAAVRAAPRVGLVRLYRGADPARPEHVRPDVGGLCLHSLRLQTRAQCAGARCSGESGLGLGGGLATRAAVGAGPGSGTAAAGSRVPASRRTEAGVGQEWRSAAAGSRDGSTNDSSRNTTSDSKHDRYPERTRHRHARARSYRLPGHTPEDPYPIPRQAPSGDEHAGDDQRSVFQNQLGASASRPALRSVGRDEQISAASRRT